MKVQRRVTPFLGFNTQAAEAAEFYVSIIPDSRIVKTVKNPASGATMLVEFELSGLPMIALNMGQECKMTYAFSLSVACETQAEIDRVWGLLADGGQEVQCGWVTDRFGLSWQVVPSQISDWMSSPDPARSGRVFNELMQMIKLDIAKLQAAYEGK
ncbi:MAG: VOC family protein [Planctomycetota bacterium]